MDVRDRGDIRVRIQPTYTVEVRTRPVSGYADALASHAFIVLLDGVRVIDSLSFDPSNSIGLEDARPDDDSRGSVILGREVKMDTWLELKDAFRRAARSVYSLGSYNCTHAVCAALIAGPNFPSILAGLELARRANRTWDALHGRMSAQDDYKKNV